jgi:hypothetical protein
LGFGFLNPETEPGSRSPEQSQFAVPVSVPGRSGLVSGSEFRVESFGCVHGT